MGKEFDYKPLKEKISDSKKYSEWSNEKLLFILNRESGLAPYTHEFVPMEQDSQILSGFISALSSFMGEIMGKQAARWKTVYGKGTQLIVENGEWVTGVIAVSYDTNEIRSKLRIIVKEFEETFANLRFSDDIVGTAFKEFDQFVRRVFTTDRISKQTLILRRTLKLNQFEDERPSVKFKLQKFLRRVKDWQTIGEAAKEQGTELEEAIELMSKAYWKNVVTLLFVPDSNDILLPGELALTILLDPQNPIGLSPETLRIVGALDGRTTLNEFVEEFDIENYETLVFELGYLLNRGFLQRLSTEDRFALIGECTASKLYKSILDKIGYQRAKNIFHSIVMNGIQHYPWLGYLKLNARGEVFFVHDPSLTPSDINAITDALEYFVNQSVLYFEKIVGKEGTKKILEMAKNKCDDKLGYLLSSVIM